MLFWSWAALLTLVAVAFITIPLLRRSRGAISQALPDTQREENLRLFAEREAELQSDLASGMLEAKEHATLLRELQLSLLDDVDSGDKARGSESAAGSPRGHWWLAGIIAVILPLLALSLYQRWGYIEDVELMGLFKRTLESQGDPEAAQVLVVELGEVVREDGEKPWVWYFLGENFATLGMFNEAQIAYLQAAERLQGEPEESLVLGRAALALYIRSEFEFTPELDALIARAREINPNEIAIIQLLAADAQNRGDYAAAIANWRLLIQNNPNSLEAQSLRAEIANAQRLLRESSGEPAEGPVIEVRLALADGIEVDPNWRVFVAARNAEREGLPPLAARDLRAGDLPVSIILDNDAAVGPFNLSSADLVTISALISRSGTANPAAGDYRVLSEPFAHNGEPAVITLLISDVVE
ncbi:MAG: c-type cytochrome biogenesis protein CcmI [Gammaproteobacteria bacterium]|jgi:cytochrome c-type biogenesis protein CcmH|nr:c-type cytochrome biogenesis protein CcmI [Gammaproteobacteria bacterium]